MSQAVVFTGRLYRFLGRQQQQQLMQSQLSVPGAGLSSGPQSPTSSGGLMVSSKSRSRSVSPQPPLAVSEAATGSHGARGQHLAAGDAYGDHADVNFGTRRSSDTGPQPVMAGSHSGLAGFRPFRNRGQPQASSANDDVASSAWRALQCYMFADGTFVQCERTEEGVDSELERLELKPLLRSSVRLVDESLLAKRHCFSTCDAAGRLAYFAAPTRQERLLWVSLLKQATSRVESRGSRYRVDRDVRVRVMEARGLRIPSGMVMASANNSAAAASADQQLGKKDNAGNLPPVAGWLATLEIGGERAARTVVVPGAVTAPTPSNAPADKKHVSAEVFWMEEFAISDLGSTGGELAVTIWSRVNTGNGRRKEVRVGTATVSLVPIKPGEVVEEWFPVMEIVSEKPAAKDAVAQGLIRRGSTNRREGSESTKEGSVVGEIRLRIRYDRLSVLPTSEYMALRKELSDITNGLMYDLLLSTESMDRLTENLVRIYTAEGKAEAWLKDLVEREVRTATDTQTLFRGNSVMTKAVDAYMKLVGWQYLDDTVGGVVRWICDSRVHCELDPARIEGKVDLQHQTEELAAYATILWKKVESTKPTFPEELRRFFAHVQYAVVSRFDPATFPNARYTCVSGFLFLRLFCPAILSPRQFELVREHPPQKTLRTLTLLAKLIQSLGNLNEFGAKEPYMTPMNPFIRDHSRGLMEFIDQVVISRKTPNLMSPIAAPATLGGVGSIPEQARMNPLSPPSMPRRSEGEAFAPPKSPYLIDLDRELAQFSSYVAAQKDKLLSGGPGVKANGTPRVSEGDALERLVNECDCLQSRVAVLRKEGKDPSKEKQ